MQRACAALLCLACCGSVAAGDEAKLLDAVHQLDYAAVGSLLAEQAAQRKAHGTTLFPFGGILTGSHDIAEPVAEGPAVTVSFASKDSYEVPLEAQLHTRRGVATLATTWVEREQHGAISFDVDLSKAEGAADGAVLSIVSGQKSLFMVPVLPYEWPCIAASQTAKCQREEKTYAGCVLAAHAECIETETADGGEEAQVGTAVRVAEYARAHGAAELQVTAVKGAYTTTVTGKLPQVVFVNEALETTVVEYTTREVSRGVTELKFALDLSWEGVVVAYAAAGEVQTDEDLLKAMGVAAFAAAETEEPAQIKQIKQTRQEEAAVQERDAEAQQGGIFWQDWQVQGCLRFADNELHANPGTDVSRALAGVRVKVSSSLTNTIFFPWGVATTNGAGCFFLQRRFWGPAGRWNRWVKIQVRLNNGLVLVANPFTVNYVLSGGYTRIRKERRNYGGNGNNNWNIGTRTLAGTSAGGGWEGEVSEDLREQAILFWGFNRFQQVLAAQGVPGLPFTSHFNFYYPTFGGVALPWGVYLEGPLGARTAFHEVSHVWHYQHMAGSYFPGILFDLLDGLSTHNCQESLGVGLLEGFAEYSSHRILPDVFGRGGQPSGGRTMFYLNNHPTCVSEGTTPLTTPARMMRNDDGNTHAFHLLTDTQFYRRNFQHSSWSGGGWAPVQWQPELNKACQWYPKVTPDYFDVLRAFLPGPGAPGWLTPWSSTQDFYNRFQAIHGIPEGWMDDRERYWNAAEPKNPRDYCRKPCPKPAYIYGHLPSPNVYGSWDTANCRLTALGSMPASPSVHNNAYYAGATPGGCPAGTSPGPWSGCRHSGYGSGWLMVYLGGAGGNTRAYGKRFGSCPAGTVHVGGWFIKTCRLVVAPAGTTLFLVGSGMPSGSNPIYVHTTQQLTCSNPSWILDSHGCKMGVPPAGTSAFLWGTTPWFYFTADI